MFTFIFHLKILYIYIYIYKIQIYKIKKHLFLIQYLNKNFKNINVHIKIHIIFYKLN